MLPTKSPYEQYIRMKAHVKTGLDCLLADKFSLLRGQRLGLLANQAAVDSSLRHAADLLIESGSCELVSLFAPEHGFRGELQDMASVSHSLDRRTKLPVHSLYGKTEASLAPTSEQLKDIDTLVVDLPDIGSRYYTFAQSLTFSMRAAKESSVKVVVLDRPNPLSGIEIEGPGLKKACRSFCGYASMPVRHGLTLGEIAKLVNQGFGEREDAVPGINCALEVVKIAGWKREMYFDDTGLPWVIPSPNMPTLDTALVYPGACLIEGTNLSEGRGSTRPFEFVGAPFIDPEKLIERVKEIGIGLEGCALRPVLFQPKFQKFADRPCLGVQVHVKDRKSFKPFRLFLALIAAVKINHQNDFSWRKDAYEFVTTSPAIDLLYGSPNFRELVDSNKSPAALLNEIKTAEKDFGDKRQELLLY